MINRSSSLLLRVSSILFAAGSIALSGCPTYVDISPDRESEPRRESSTGLEPATDVVPAELAVTMDETAITDTEQRGIHPQELGVVDNPVSGNDRYRPSTNNDGATGLEPPPIGTSSEPIETAAPPLDESATDNQAARPDGTDSDTTGPKEAAFEEIGPEENEPRPLADEIEATSEAVPLVEQAARPIFGLQSSEADNPLRDPTRSKVRELSNAKRAGDKPGSPRKSTEVGLATEPSEKDQRSVPDESPPTHDLASSKGEFVFSERVKPAKREDDGSHQKAGNAIDFVEKNGPIFVGWKRPKVAILFSGEQNGYIEPCGCSGLETQKGGLKRRHTLVKELQADGWPVVPLDVGGQVKRFGPQAEIKFRNAVDALSKIGYQAIGFGPKDLRLDVMAVALEFDARTTPFVSTNVALHGFDSGFTRRFRVIESGGKRIGVTSVLGKGFAAQFKGDPAVSVMDPEDALAEVVPQLQDARCDVLVLLSHATPKESTDLAKRFRVFDFVATSGGAEEPPAKAAVIDGTSTRLIEVGAKGMYVVVVGVYDDPDRRFLDQRVTLDARFKDSPEIHASMIAYQKELETLGLDGLEVKAVPYGNGRRFAGTESCVDCHTEAAEVFEDTPHAHATQTLIDISDPPRQFDPECLSCHVTGWDPQKFFPYESGFISLEETPHLRANGCENCHGPGAAHVAAENGNAPAGDAELERLRAALRLKLVENEGNMTGQNGKGRVVRMCIECHDLDNSPDFDFQKYMPEVEHYGME